MKIAIIGLGYVGLPLAIEFGKKYSTIGFDISKIKINNLNNFVDITREISKRQFIQSKFLSFTSDPKTINSSNIFIIAVPTPVNKKNLPDLSPLVEATKIVSSSMNRKSIIIYEPTVYPGTIEDICIPLLEKYSKLKWKKDFNVGYSPERINPGDKSRSLTKIIKIVAADTKKTLKTISDLYRSIIKAGIYCASSIKVAETAKVMENTQRDLNIALMNELAKICHKTGIDTSEVIKVASTKWNFVPFKPGLVGGHCIGVDPYYLTHKAKLLGVNPKVILSGREINDSMSFYIGEKIINYFKDKHIKVNDAKINVLGVTFKEDCSDIRNSKTIELIKFLSSEGYNVNVHDPLAIENNEFIDEEISLTEWDKLIPSHVLVCAVPHKSYKKIGINKILSKLRINGMFFDIKATFSQKKIQSMGYETWRL